MAEPTEVNVEMQPPPAVETQIQYITENVTPDFLLELSHRITHDLGTLVAQVRGIASQVQDLTVQVDRVATQVGHVTDQVAALPQPVTQAPRTLDRKVPVVEKPAPFKGKNSEEARLFRSAFAVYAGYNSETFGIRDATGTLVRVNGEVQLDATKVIVNALSFMVDDAALWARPHIETAAEGRAPFSTTHAFFEAFKTKFEPIDATAEAKQRLMSLRQDGTFAVLISEFETWSPRTGWRERDLYDRLKACLSKEYLSRISYFQDVATDYPTLKKQAQAVDRQLNDLANNANRGYAKTTKSPATMTTASAWRDPNAMDIDATNFDSMFVNVPRDSASVSRRFKELMVKRCKVCGSSSHENTPGRHAGNDKCNWCGRNGHWANICINRILGKPRVQGISATTAGSPAPSTSGNPPLPNDSISASTDHEAEMASLRDTLESQRKLIESMQAQIGASF